jgi:hypothetical protein
MFCKSKTRHFFFFCVFECLLFLFMIYIIKKTSFPNRLLVNLVAGRTVYFIDKTLLYTFCLQFT